MGLRARVALTLVAAIIPISLIFSIWRIGAEHRLVMERRAERASARIQRVEDGGCRVRRPRGHRGRGRRMPPAHRYSSTFEPHRDAPPFPVDLQSVMQSEDPVHMWNMPGGEWLGATAIKVADSGPCAVVLIPWRSEDAPPGAMTSALLQTTGLAGILAVLGMLVALPIVRRIRRLEDAVRRAQREPFQLNLGGDDEINRLAATFSETIDAVRARELALEEYIANTTHDLAIPLTVLQHRLRKLAAQDNSDDVRVALEEAHYIGALIANMRAAAKLEAPDALELTHEVDLCEIVERVVQRHGPIAEQKGIELNFARPELPLVVNGEPTLVEQALSNLVQNAVQYNAAGGHVSVVLEDVGKGFELIVADDGPGIPKALRDEVMKRGVRDDAARSRNEGGQGFGLAIVRRVAALHGWSFAFEHPDEGLIARLKY